MRFFTSYDDSSIRTVKAQGQLICQAWKEYRGQEVRLERIVRNLDRCYEGNQEGFVVLCSLFNEHLCHYSFSIGQLRIVEESGLDITLPAHLECPASLLTKAKPANSVWRERVKNYSVSSKSLDYANLAKDETIALKHPYSIPGIWEQAYLIKRKAGDWFAVEEDGTERYVRLDLEEIHAHGGYRLQADNLTPVHPEDLPERTFMLDGMYFSTEGDQVSVLGRPLTIPEMVAFEVRSIPPMDFSAERPIWC